VTLPSSEPGGGARENVTAERSARESLYSLDPRLWPGRLDRTRLAPRDGGPSSSEWGRRPMVDLLPSGHARRMTVRKEEK
jgi:hypothetical protein